jgi:hypothetical protein
MTTFTLSDALGFIASEATEDDCNRIIEVVRGRHKTLTVMRAATLTTGATVTLNGLSPKALNGLRGTVTSIEGQRATVLLTEDSTDRLRWSRTRYSGLVASAVREYSLGGVPLGCCHPDAA